MRHFSNSSACASSGFTRGNDGHFYKMSKESKTWHEARDSCRSQNSQLAIVNSGATHNYLSSLSVNLGNIFWIGVHDYGIEGRFENVDGTPVKKTYWHPGEPNNAGDDEDCVEYHPTLGKWNDRPCSYLSRYLCQRYSGPTYQYPAFVCS